jgi:hypothetical protein
MKSVVAPLVAAIVLAVAGGAFWIAGKTETRLAEVHKQLATLHYAEAEIEGQAVEESLGLERRVPVVGRAVETDMRDARAAAGYWRADYEAIAPRKDANGVVTETDPAILFLSANAAFRASQAATDRSELVRRLDSVVKSYGDVLKTEAAGCDTSRVYPGGSSADICAARATDAAYNYEYAIRQRESFARGRPVLTAKAAAARVPLRGQEEEQDLPSGPTLHGHPGGPPPATDMNQFKIVIPKRGEERKDAPEAGKGGQKVRKG